MRALRLMIPSLLTSFIQEREPLVLWLIIWTMDLHDLFFIARPPTLSSSYHFVQFRNVKCCMARRCFPTIILRQVGAVLIMRYISTLESIVLSTGQRTLIDDCGNVGRDICRGSNQYKVFSIAIVRPTLQSTVCVLFTGADDTPQPWRPIRLKTLQNMVITFWKSDCLIPLQWLKKDFFVNFL